MTVNKVLILFLFLSFNLSAFAQSNFLPGYIVDREGDTLKRFIDYRGGVKNSKEAELKMDLNASTSITYFPEQLISYSVNGKVYISKDIKIRSNDSIVSKRVFLEILEKGKVTLYYYKENKDQFFIQKDSSDLVELQNNKSKIQIKGKTYIAEDKQYLKVLNQYLTDCPKVSGKTSIQFTELHISAIIRKYNQCLNPDSVLIKGKGPTFKIGVGIGYNHSTLKPDYTHTSPFGKNGLSAGLSVNMSSRRLNNISIQYDLFYNKKGSSSISEDYNFDYLDLGLLVKYTYPSGIIRPYIGLGVIAGILLNPDHAFTTEKNGVRSPMFLSIAQNYLHKEYGRAIEAGFLIPTGKHGVIFGFRNEQTRTSPYLIPGSTYQFKLGFIY